MAPGFGTGPGLFLLTMIILHVINKSVSILGNWEFLSLIYSPLYDYQKLRLERVQIRFLRLADRP